MVSALARTLLNRLGRPVAQENGAIGLLILGIVVGAIVVIVLIVQLLIPGDGD